MFLLLGTVKEAGVGTDCCCEGEVVVRLWTGQQEFKVMPFAKVLPMMGKNASNISATLFRSGTCLGSDFLFFKSLSDYNLVLYSGISLDCS